MQVKVDVSTDLVLMSHVDCLEFLVSAPVAYITASKCPYVVTEIKKAVKLLKSCQKYMKFDNLLCSYYSSDLEVESGASHHADCWERAGPESH